MSYENAPATKLLATNCACCGRALVDAVSVEAGVGPDCREMHGFGEAQGEADWAAAEELLRGTGAAIDSAEDPRQAANKLVHLVAKSARSIDRAGAQRIFSAIAALGFTTLADRIAKRFRAAVLVLSELTEAETRAARAEYARVRAAFVHDNCSREEFDAIVRSTNPATPAQWVECAKEMACTCKKCGGSGVYSGPGLESGGDCYRCGGKGYQTHEDVARNRAYDAHRAGRVAA